MNKFAKSILMLFFFFLMIFLLNSNSYASTTITIDLNPAIPIGTIIDTDEMANQIQHTTDQNGPFVANAFALANVLGYPIGKSYIGSFPNFEIGLAMGSGCTNMKYFDKSDPAHDNGTLPMFAPNPVLHFGVGIAGGFDLIGKMFYVSKAVVNRYKSDINYEVHGTELKDYKIYSTGAKLRYYYIKEKKFLPFYLSFGGVTFSLGGNFMYGDIKFIGKYKYNFEDISFTMPPSPTPVNVPMQFDGQFDANIHWAIFTLDAQAVAYFDIFYLFSLYTGFGAAGNIGSFKLESGGTGNFTTTQPAPFDQMGTLIFSSKNKYRPSPVMPLYILGLEINILVVKLNVETMVNLLNRSDVNAQFGTRLQF
jgi:hypothetical protein